MPRTHIGRRELAEVVSELLHIFEIPVYIGGMKVEAITNSYTAFRASQESGDLWRRYVGKQPKNKPFDHSIIYSYYKQLLEDRLVEPWAFFALFLLVFPTGNAMSERGFSAMKATHSKERSALSHEQTLANMVIEYNGPSVFEFAASIDKESREKFGPEWWGYVHPSTSSI
jgi:hypothetical protein